jgi:hypothetical protein
MAFLARPSEQAKSAIAALQVVAHEESYDTASRVSAIVQTDHAFEAFVKRYGLKRANGGQCIQRLTQGRCYGGYPHKRCACRPPAADHITLWNKDGKPAIYVSQPYGLSYKDLQETLAFCEAYHLNVLVDTWPSWHFPGHTLSLLYTAKERPLHSLDVDLAARSARLAASAIS